MLKTAVSENFMYFLSKEDGVNYLPSHFYFLDRGHIFLLCCIAHNIVVFAGIRKILVIKIKLTKEIYFLFLAIPYRTERTWKTGPRGMFSSNVV